MKKRRCGRLLASTGTGSILFLGRALGVPVALEGALNCEEISDDHAEGFTAGELKHGPLALVTSETPVLAVLTEGADADETVNNVIEAQTPGACRLARSTVPSTCRFRCRTWVWSSRSWRTSTSSYSRITCEREGTGDRQAAESGEECHR